MDWISEIAKGFPIESLPDVLQPLAETIGIENTLRVVEQLGGLSVYFVKLERLVRPWRDDQIHKEFTGSNHRYLAKKYNLTEMQIRRILSVCRA